MTGGILEDLNMGGRKKAAPEVKRRGKEEKPNNIVDGIITTPSSTSKKATTHSTEIGPLRKKLLRGYATDGPKIARPASQPSGLKNHIIIPRMETRESSDPADKLNDVTKELERTRFNFLKILKLRKEKARLEKQLVDEPSIDKPTPTEISMHSQIPIMPPEKTKGIARNEPAPLEMQGGVETIEPEWVIKERARKEKKARIEEINRILNSIEGESN